MSPLEGDFVVAPGQVYDESTWASVAESDVFLVHAPTCGTTRTAGGEGNQYWMVA